MDLPKKYLHDRLVLALITLISIMTVIGISVVLLSFDISKNPTTTIAYRPSISSSSYQSGKPIDIYVLALFMAITAAGAVILSARVYPARREIAILLLGAAVFLLLLATIVSNSLISLQ
jgi:hypothetical protein